MPLGTRKLKLALQYPAGVSLFPKIVSVRAPGDSCYFAVSKIVESLLRRGARWFERTGLKPAGLRFRRGGAPKGRLIGLAGKKASAMRAVYSTKPRRGLQYHKAVFADDLDAVDGE